MLLPVPSFYSHNQPQIFYKNIKADATPFSQQLPFPSLALIPNLFFPVIFTELRCLLVHLISFH